MKYYAASAFVVLTLFAGSCTKDGDDPIVTPTVVKEWTVPLAAVNENPAPAGRTETGTANLKLYSDNSLQYTISVTGLASGDALNNAHLHTGDVITSGPVVLPFSPTFSGSSATGTVTGLRASLVDSLKSASNEIYLNVHSTQAAAGLVRGQLNKTLDMVANVVMNGDNESPAVTTTATGMAMIRLTSDKKLYSKISVEGLESDDALSAAHIHSGAAGANGGVLVGIYGSAAEFGTTKISDVDDATFASLKADPLYVNAHSTNHPSGVIRGQIR